LTLAQVDYLVQLGLAVGDVLLCGEAPGSLPRGLMLSNLCANLEAGSHHTQGVVLGLRLAEVPCGRGVRIYQSVVRGIRMHLYVR
jgi:hypothetical protein